MPESKEYRLSERAQSILKKVKFIEAGERAKSAADDFDKGHIPLIRFEKLREDYYKLKSDTESPGV